MTDASQGKKLAGPPKHVEARYIFILDMVDPSMGNLTQNVSRNEPVF